MNEEPEPHEEYTWKSREERWDWLDRMYAEELKKQVQNDC